MGVVCDFGVTWVALLCCGRWAVLPEGDGMLASLGPSDFHLWAHASRQLRSSRSEAPSIVLHRQVGRRTGSLVSLFSQGGPSQSSTRASKFFCKCASQYSAAS